MLVSAFQLKNSWPWGGATFELRWFYNRTWTDIDGNVHLKGEVGPNSPCLRCPGTIAGETATVLSFEHPATVNSPDRPSVRATGAVFDQDGNYRATVFKSIQFPIGIDPITEKVLSVYNRGLVKRLADKYLNRDQILALFGEFAGVISAASDVVLGAVFLDAHPVDAAAPTAVSTNSPRVARAYGTGVLVAATTATVNSALVAADSAILVCSADNGIVGSLRVSNRVVGVSFDVDGDVGTDAGNFRWFLY